MKITGIRTLGLGEYPNLCWVEVSTDEGLTGTGETFVGPESVASYIHETAAPYLLGKDPSQIELHWLQLYGHHARLRGMGAETRGASALDIALWDLLAQSCGKPLYDLLGGRTRTRIRAYNTCGGYGYARKPIVGTWDDADWSNIGAATGPYEDLEAARNRPAELAHSLLDEGFTAMKIWPLDELAAATDGHSLLPQDLERGLEPLRKIRDAVGGAIDVALEMHSRWTLTAAKRIAAAAEQYEPMWFEDPIRMDNFDALEEFARSTRIPTTASEVVAGKGGYRELLERHFVGYVMIDIGWCGGLTEARKIAAMADAYHLPFTPHDCTGPIGLTGGVHLTVSQPNAVLMEMVRAYYSSWYPQLVTELPSFDRGSLAPPEGSGLGTALLPDVWLRGDSTVRVSD